MDRTGDAAAMARVSVGDHVSDLNGSHDGKLVDVDGTTGYVLQRNGVELEFPLDRLKPYEAAGPKEERTLSGPLRDRVLTPAERRLLTSVPADVLAAVAKSYDASRDGAPDRPTFATLPESKRLDAIRIHLPTLPARMLALHMNLLIAYRDLARPGRP